MSRHLGEPVANVPTGKLGASMVPITHSGFVLQLNKWWALGSQVRESGFTFVREPWARFEGGSVCNFPYSFDTHRRLRPASATRTLRVSDGFGWPVPC